MRGTGAVAQLGERSVRNAKVRGSIPLCSTIPVTHPQVPTVCRASSRARPLSARRTPAPLAEL